MNAKEYSEQAHSTACHGGTLVYPMCALTEELSEVFKAFWDGHTTEAHKFHVADELMDVVWNINEIAVLASIDFSDIEKNAFEYAKRIAIADEEVKIDYEKKFLNCLGHMVDKIGSINGIFAKYVRKHDGQLPNVSTLAVCAKNGWTAIDSIPKNEMDHTLFRNKLIEPLVETTGAVIHALDQIGFGLPEGYVINTTKLAKRKANNTLGGAGSVERKE